jgi:hypothetical protein
VFHIVYNSYESESGGRDYIGKHSTKNLSDGYLGSFKDKTFNPDSKIILGYSKTKEGAVWLEIQFQRVFGVVEDNQFANKSYQTSTKFSYTDGCPGDKNGMYGRTGERNPNFGNNYSEESRQKIREFREGKTAWHDPETGEDRWFDEPPIESKWVRGFSKERKVRMKNNQKSANKGRTTFYNPETGGMEMCLTHPGDPWVKGQNPEQVKNRAEKHRGSKRTPEAIKNMKEAQRKRNRIGTTSNQGKKHWVNVEGERKYQYSSPGPEWQNGWKWKEGKTS